jgi:hypothetical protein
MQNKKTILALFVVFSFIAIQGCKENKVYQTHKKTEIDSENYIELNSESFETPEGNVINYDEIQYEIKGKMSGKSFNKTFKGIPIMDFELWEEKIILISLHGFLIYNPSDNSHEWVYQDENNFIRYPILKFDEKAGNLYSLCSFYPDMEKYWIAIDIVKRNISKIKIGNCSNDFSLTLAPQGAIAKACNSTTLIKPLEDGGFEFIAKE